MSFRVRSIATSDCDTAHVLRHDNYHVKYEAKRIRESIPSGQSITTEEREKISSQPFVILHLLCAVSLIFHNMHSGVFWLKKKGGAKLFIGRLIDSKQHWRPHHGSKLR